MLAFKRKSNLESVLLPDVALLEVVEPLLVVLHLLLAVCLKLLELVHQLLLLLPELLERVELLGEHHDLPIQLVLGGAGQEGGVVHPVHHHLARSQYFQRLNLKIHLAVQPSSDS